MKKINHKKGLLLLILIILGILLFNTLDKPSEVQTIPIIVTVGEKVGIDVNTTALTFGTVKPGTQAERTIILKGEREEKITLVVKNIPFVTPTEKTIIIKKDEIKKVTIIAAPAKTTERKTYEGELIIKGISL